MRNKRTKALYILFFIAAVFFAAFVLAEFRGDYIAIALAGIVMLIAAYLLVDKIERDIYERYEIDKKDINDKLDENSQEIIINGNKIDRLQEAILNASLHGLTDPQQKITELSNNLAEVEQALLQRQNELLNHKIPSDYSKQLENILQAQRENVVLLKTGFKALIQFSKENARQVALNTNENTEKVLNELSDTVHRLSEELPK
ncbi:MAG: hypothetical protein PUC65_02345, partial [Clostridiales bacterium]|nr:hypothetical protein [Clostridiales bacterium]